MSAKAARRSACATRPDEQLTNGLHETDVAYAHLRAAFTLV